MLLLFFIFFPESCFSQSLRRHYENTSDADKGVIGFVGTVALSLSLFCCWYCWRQVFPRENMFTALELDDIRLERIDERESFLKKQMKNIQTKLVNYRTKKTEIQVRRDMTEKLEENLSAFNDKGLRIYGDQWETGKVKEMLSLPDKEVQNIKIEAQNILTQRKAEEQRDMWKLWDDYRVTDKSFKSKKTNRGDTSFRVSSNRDSDDIVLTARSTRQDQANNLTLAAASAGRMSSERAQIDARFMSDQSGNSRDNFSEYKKKNKNRTVEDTSTKSSLDLGKISFPPNGVRRPDRINNKRIHGNSDDYRSQSQPQEDYRMELGVTKPIGSPYIEPSSSQSQSSTRKKTANPLDINPMHGKSSPLQKLDLTHDAFDHKYGTGPVWGAGLEARRLGSTSSQGNNQSGHQSVLLPPPDVRPPPSTVKKTVRPALPSHPRPPPRGPGFQPLTHSPGSILSRPSLPPRPAPPRRFRPRPQSE
jgi:hypothetical protein